MRPRTHNPLLHLLHSTEEYLAELPVGTDGVGMLIACLCMCMRMRRRMRVFQVDILGGGWDRELPHGKRDDGPVF